MYEIASAIWYTAKDNIPQYQCNNPILYIAYSIWSSLCLSLVYTQRTLLLTTFLFTFVYYNIIQFILMKSYNLLKVTISIAWKSDNWNYLIQKSEWLLFNANSEIFQLYHGKNKLIFQWDDDEFRFVLDLDCISIWWLVNFTGVFTCNHFIIIPLLIKNWLQTNWISTHSGINYKPVYQCN